VERVKRILEFIGIEGDRVQMHFCSSAEGEKYAMIIKEGVEKIRAMGPNPLKAKPASQNDHHE
jgi:F420-non-reducing hydrogenase iron-sulfur subunit